MLPPVFVLLSFFSQNTIRFKIGNIGFVVLLNFLIKPVWLVMENMLQNRLGHEAWGTYSALSSFAIALTVLTDFGVNQYTIKSLAADTGKFQSWFPGLMGFKILLLIAYPLLLFGLGALMGYPLQELCWLMLIALSLAALQLLQFLRSFFQAFQHFKLDAIASVLDKVLLTLFCLAWLLSESHSFETFLLLPAASTVFSLLVFLMVVYRLYGGGSIRWDWTFTRRILKLSFPFALITVVYAVHDKIDKVMLEKISGPYENGLYSAASRWVDALMMYTWIIMGLYYARFARFVRDREETARLLRNGQLLGGLPMIPAFLILYFKGPWLTGLLLPSSTPAEIQTIQSCLVWLALATLINSTLVIYSTLLTATGHERPVTRMVFISILIKAALNMILIPVWGGVAAAWATLLSFGFLSILYLSLTHRLASVQPVWDELIRIALLLVLSFSAGWMAIFGGMSDTAGLAIALFVFVVVGMGMGFLKPQRIRNLMA